MKKDDLRYFLARINQMKIVSLPYLYEVFEARTDKQKKRIREDLKVLVKKGFVVQKAEQVYMPVFKKDNIKHDVIGYEAPKKDFYTICSRFGITPSFSDKVIQEADKVAHIPEKEVKKRKDYRNQLVFTIDGEDAKDLDDAISLEKIGDYYKLYVFIADVSFYVRENSFLDQEAYKRGTSIYLSDRVVPMLPKVISNGICSLNANEDKLCFTAEMMINAKGDIVKSEFFAGIMKSVRRFTYREVEDIFINRASSRKGDEELLPMLFEMEKLAKILRKKRFDEGAIDFDIPEMKIYCDKKSRPIEIKNAERLFSNNLIEEFMLSANKSVAVFLENQGIGMYRVHESPDEDKIREFINTVNLLGYQIKNFSDSKELQNFLDQTKGHPESFLINTMLLRSMQQAYYHHENFGHFGLSFSHYTHFTSPIRRYPDLIVHRLLKMLLGIEKHEKKVLDPEFLSEASKQSSKMERNAVDMERAMQKRKAIHYMKDKIGKPYTGIVTGVTDFGVYVTLDNMGIEGLVSRNLLTYFDYDEAFRTYKHGSTVLRIGKPVKIRVLSLNLKRELIDFVLAD